MYHRMVNPLFTKANLGNNFTKTSKCCIWYFLIMLPMLYLFCAHLGMALLSLALPTDDCDSSSDDEDDAFC